MKVEVRHFGGGCSFLQGKSRKQLQDVHEAIQIEQLIHNAHDSSDLT